MGQINRYSKSIARAMIVAYQNTLSVIMKSRCNFIPSCSNYALEAIHRYGIIRGLNLSVRRIIRCHPFAQGGIDPVPQTDNSTETNNAK